MSGHTPDPLRDAAPDMLEALKALLSDYDGWSGHNDDGFSDERLAKARAAIAKAEGRI